MIDINDLMARTREDRARHLKRTSFEDCVELRKVSLFLDDSEFNSPSDVTSAVSGEFGIDRDTAECRILQFISILEAPKGELSISSRLGIEYFSGSSLDELVEESRYSKGEIQRDLRGFVSECLEKAPRPLEFKTAFPPVDRIREEFGAVFQSFSQIDLNIPDDRAPYGNEYPFSWLGFLPPAAYEKIYGIYSTEDEGKVRQILANSLEEVDVHEHVNDTKFFEGDRKRLYFEALEAFRDGKYALSIPLALTQIDGLVIELAIELGIWEADNQVKGADVMLKAIREQSPKSISEVDEFISEYYRRLMGEPRAKILHGRETGYIGDREFASELIWFWVSIFYLVDRIHFKNTIQETRLLEFLAVSQSKALEEVVERFDSQMLHVDYRLNELCEEGLLEVEDGEYTISEAGKNYLLSEHPYFVLE